jgi:hypothetical protein
MSSEAHQYQSVQSVAKKPHKKHHHVQVINPIPKQLNQSSLLDKKLILWK